MVQWLRLPVSTGGDAGSIPGRGTKVLHAAWCDQKKKIFFLIEVQLIYNVVLVSGVQQTDSVVHIYNSLHLLIPNSQSIPPPPTLPLRNHKSVLYVCESVSAL